MRHLSGQGFLWELDGETPDEYEGEYDWCVKGKHENVRHWLPKVEYALCDPPKVVEVSQ